MITLTTDFGLKDPYVAEMKGVILTINPNANIVDVTHGVDKFNVRMGAFMLASAAPYFPEAPCIWRLLIQVWAQRDVRFWCRRKQGFFVGPDNGVLMLAAQAAGNRAHLRISQPKVYAAKGFSTFHGRDVFAPAAAHLDKGVETSEFGPEITDPVTPKFASVEHKNGCFNGRSLACGRLRQRNYKHKPKEVAEAKTVKVNLHHISLHLAFAKTYAANQTQEPIALVGSHGFLELALNQGSFS